jgi:hypothetical protein
MMVKRTALEQAIEDAAGQAVMLPVQRQNMHGGQMAPDTMIAIPVHAWEKILGFLPADGIEEPEDHDLPEDYWETAE